MTEAINATHSLKCRVSYYPDVLRCWGVETASILPWKKHNISRRRLVNQLRVYFLVACNNNMIVSPHPRRARQSSGNPRKTPLVWLPFEALIRLLAETLHPRLGFRLLPSRKLGDDPAEKRSHVVRSYAEAHGQLRADAKHVRFIKDKPLSILFVYEG